MSLLRALVQSSVTVARSPWEARTGLCRGAKEPPLWSEESETFQPIGEQPVLHSHGCERKGGVVRGLFIHLPHFRAGRTVEKGDESYPRPHS